MSATKSAPASPTKFDLRAHAAALALVAATLTVLALAIADGQRPEGALLDEQVLATVPARGPDHLARTVAMLGRRLEREPRNATLAAELGRAALAAGRRGADPRLIGRAEAALGPWWTDIDPPSEILLLRATIKQAHHDFEPALRDLERLLQREPEHREARLLQATVLTVRGRFADARKACAHLGERDFVAVACAAPADAALGDPAAVLAGLEAAIARAPVGSAAWGLSLAGEIAYWAGFTARAEGLLRRSLALDPGDGYTRLVLADLLLDADRPDEVIALLAEEGQKDAALLRLALAEQRREGRGGPRTRELSAKLAARFAAAQRRGDLSHGREEARFALWLADDPARAYARARQNWQSQHEPWDARLVLASAAAAKVAPLPEVSAFVRARGTAWARAEKGDR